MDEHETNETADAMWEGDFLTRLCVDLYCRPLVPPLPAEVTRLEVARHRRPVEPRQDSGSAGEAGSPALRRSA